MYHGYFGENAAPDCTKVHYKLHFYTKYYAQAGPQERPGVSSVGPGVFRARSGALCDRLFDLPGPQCLTRHDLLFESVKRCFQNTFASQIQLFTLRSQTPSA